MTAVDRSIGGVEDEDAIMRLLTEYTEKLGAIRDRWERVRFRQNALIAAAVLLPFIIATGTVAFVNGSPDLMAFFLGTGVGLSLILLRLSDNYLVKFLHRPMLYELDVAATKVTRLVQLASSLAEHSIDSPVRRLELELRLAETEVALRGIILTLERYGRRTSYRLYKAD